MGSGTERGWREGVFLLRNGRQGIQCVWCVCTNEGCNQSIYVQHAPLPASYSPHPFRREVTESRWSFAFIEGNSLCTKDAEGTTKWLMYLYRSFNSLRSPRCFENLCAEEGVGGILHMLLGSGVTLCNYLRHTPGFRHHPFYTHTSQTF